MGVEDAFTVDDGPVSNDVAVAQFAGVFDAHVKDQVTGQQGGVHRFGLDGEHPDAENAGDAVAGAGNKGHVGAHCGQGDGDDQDGVDNTVQDALTEAFFLDDLEFLFCRDLLQFGLGLLCLFLLKFHVGDLPSVFVGSLSKSII